jgi:hypothetical protein
MVRSWYEVGTKLVRSWYEVGTKLVRSYGKWYEVGTKCVDKRRCFFLNRNLCLLQQLDMSSCWTSTRVFLLSKKTCLLCQQEDMFSFSTRRHVFLFNEETCVLIQQEACVLVQKEDIFSCRTKSYILQEIIKKDMIKMTTKASMKVHLTWPLSWSPPEQLQ